MDDDLPDDEYVSDAERIQRLERQVTELRVKTELLERQIRELDMAGLRTQSAVLEERVDGFMRRETILRDRLTGLGGLVLLVLLVSSGNLLVTLIGR